LTVQIYQANLPDESLPAMSNLVETGVYFGYAQVAPSKEGGPPDVLTGDDVTVLPMVMSLGWNPFYKNERMTAVCDHILGHYQQLNNILL
jgi:riboflavin kinase